MAQNGYTLPHQDNWPIPMESYDRIREAVVFWSNGMLSFDSLDDWPVERLYRFADGYIEARAERG
jgi:hypothetical protein